MTEEDEEFNRIEREAAMRKETVKEHMTKDEALKLALAALKKNHYYMIDAGLPNQSMLNEGFAAFKACEQALADIKQDLTPVHERNFCERCGKRLGDYIHTCTPPAAPV
jgi:hypothetical protein